MSLPRSSWQLTHLQMQESQWRYKGLWYKIFYECIYWRAERTIKSVEKKYEIKKQYSGSSYLTVKPLTVFNKRKIHTIKFLSYMIIFFFFSLIFVGLCCILLQQVFGKFFWQKKVFLLFLLSKMFFFSKFSLLSYFSYFSSFSTFPTFLTFPCCPNF